MVARGQRRLGRTIGNLENSVGFGPKEVKIMESERKYREEIEQDFEDSPVQMLRFLAKKKIRTS